MFLIAGEVFLRSKNNKSFPEHAKKGFVFSVKELLPGNLQYFEF
ncbi:hypothetical protein SAMN02927921_01066 [Sinomicrobium oceani]|uniref:Uncharacterized protein n=1 Tax=Sinomicrobium oceani TaxID=1150368 RepID=A0A1K1N6X8_9FLAO|nr:hypothetical protein SAMN02927921_01066 [Sinomicrobium oceani]